MSDVSTQKRIHNMERKNSFSNGLKDHSINGNNKAINKVVSNNNQSDYKLKDSMPWRSGAAGNVNNQGFGEDYLGEFSWPPRSYTCSFCKREFRSAQALGGHMNVHRRDRARLRQSPPKDLHLHLHDQGHGQSTHPPFLNLNLNPNPNPNFSSSSSTTSSSSLSSSLLSSPPLSSLSSPMKKWRLNGTLIDPLTTSKGSEYSTNYMVGAKSCFGVKEFKDINYGCINNNFLKKKTTEYVALDLDLEVGTMVSDSKEDLDLELRLGYS